MEDDLRSRTTDSGAYETSISLRQTLREQLKTGRPLHEATDALMTAAEQQMPGTACAVVPSAMSGAGPLLASAVPNALINALVPLDPIGRIDAWLHAVNAHSCGAGVVSLFGIEDSAALDDLRSAVAAGGYKEAWLAPVISPAGKAFGMMVVGFRSDCGASAPPSALIGEAAFLAALLIDGHCRNALIAERDLLRAAFDTGREAMIVADARSQSLIGVNAAFTALFGYRADELAGKPLSLLRRDQPGMLLDMEELAKVDTAVCRPQLFKKNGDVLHVECTARIVESRGRRLLFIVARGLDQERRAENRLALAAKVYETMGEGAIIADADHVILSVNRALQTMTGYSADEMIGCTPEFLYGEPTQWREMVQRCMKTGIRCEEEIFVRCKDARFFPCLLSLSIAAGDGGPIRLIGIYKDITQRRRHENHLRFLASHDVLTRLPNRMQFYKRLDLAIGDAKRDARSFAVLFIDLDRFKNINDTFGHSAGDLLLQMVAERLRRHIRKSDLLARLGGDEFTVLAEMMPDMRDVMVLADHIMAALAGPFHIEGHELFVTASIGISVFPHDGRDAETLIKSADTAMYHAKGLGKNNYQFFLTEMNIKALEHLQLESALRHALERNEFMLYYQPKVHAPTEHIFGMEALLRWNHPTLGIIAPGRFIPLAEETGMIREIGSWALREACRQNAVWQRAGYPSLVVSVNLSTLQLMGQDFTETVAGVLKETGLPAESLELELTESAIMESPEQSALTLQALRDMGVKISIDDFGTGYSSLSYLKRYPINTLKIDQSFVRDINIDANDAAITDAVISLARSLNMQVIAEGVETPEQLCYLQHNGCDAYQGFLFSRPLPSNEFQQLLTIEPQS